MCVSIANMLCQLTTIMLLAPNVGWLLTIVVWILRIPALPVKAGLGLRRALIDARARAEQRGKQHWTAACPHVEAWILAKPVSTSASEISSQAGEGDFDDEILVDTPKQHEVQVLVVQAQNGANMATSSTPTAAGTTITAASTAALQAGPSTKEPIVEQLGQDTPSVIQGACACSGHVTGQRSLRGRGSRKGLQRAPTNTMLFSDYHLAKLNPNCHMNYSIIFTEISFSPETSSPFNKVWI